MIIEFDGHAFTLLAVKKAAYRLSDLFATEITLQGNIIKCALRISDQCSDSPSTIENAFRTAVLDQDLRERIGEETGPLRNAILAMAFAPLAPQRGD